MLNSFRLLSLLLLLLFVSGLGGCSSTPTRHLVSDVCMIKSGQTNRQEVLNLMGEPDSRRKLEGGIEEWVYYEEDRAVLQGTPLVGDAFEAKGYNMVRVTFDGDTVKTCQYRGYDEDEFDWQDDYSWQEIEK